MQVDKLEQWLRRDRKHAARLRLHATELGAQGVLVSEWPREELGSSPLEAVQLACADYCDTKGESVNFRLEWLRSDGSSLCSMFHRQAPLQDSDGEPLGKDARNADISVNRLVAFMMRKDEAKDRLIVGAIAAIFHPLEQTIKLQQHLIDTQNKQIVSLTQQLQVRVDSDDESTEEARAESLARAGAWNKLAEIAPLAVQAVVESHVERQRRGTNGSGQA